MRSIPSISLTYSATTAGTRDSQSSPFSVEPPLDHLVTLAGRERVLPRVTVLRRPDPDDDLGVRLEDPLYHGEMAPVERLEPTDEEGAAGHSSSSPRKWPM